MGKMFLNLYSFTSLSPLRTRQVGVEWACCGSGLVIKSASMALVLQYDTLMSLLLTASQIQCHLMSMCFDFTQLGPSSHLITHLLSSRIRVLPDVSMLMLCCNHLSHKASLLAWERATVTYLASLLNSVTAN